MKRVVKLMFLCFASMAFLAGCGSSGGGGGSDESFKPVEFENRDNVTYEYEFTDLESDIDDIDGKLFKNTASPYKRVSASDYTCPQITNFLNKKGKRGYKLFDIVEVQGAKYWLFIKGKDTNYTYDYDTRLDNIDSNYLTAYSLMLSNTQQLNDYGQLGYDRAKIYHNSCAFYEKDDNSNITVEFKSTTGVYHSIYIDKINNESKNGYQFYNSGILNPTYLGGFLTLKRYSDTKDQVYKSEFQNFVAYGENGAERLLSQLNREADKGYLFTANIVTRDITDTSKIIEVNTLYSKHLTDTQKVVYKYLKYDDINELVYELNKAGTEGGLLSHYGNLDIYGDSLRSTEVLETKTAIGYNLDCSDTSKAIPCKIIY
jgi:hypothetical protein